MLSEIEAAIAKIRPALQADGGDIELVDFKDGILKVRLKGACAGCPMSQMTLANFVEQKIREKIPGIKKVEAVL